MRHINNPNFNALVLRHVGKQITDPGGLWDTARTIYSYVKGATTRKTPTLQWIFPSGASVTFSHLTSNDDCDGWQGSQICLIEFDELCHFSEYQFFYMLSRNRSTCGVVPYIRATCNPDADSWVAKFISWWIDQDTGYPIKERSGVIRWMVRYQGVIHWFDTRDNALQYARTCGMEQKYAEDAPKSVTFIPSSVTDNKELLKTNPGYMTNLLSLTLVDQERLLKGNWKIRNQAGLMFKRSQVNVVPRESIRKEDIVTICRGWDLAATPEDANGDPAYTAGVLMAKLKDGRFVILDVVNQRLSAGDVENLILNCSLADRAKFGYVRTRIPKDPGQAGVAQAAYYIKKIASNGLDIAARPESGDKVTRATPVAALWQHGSFSVAEGEWNEIYFSQLESFPDSKFKDMVDATSSAFDEITNYMSFNLSTLI